MCSKSSIDCGTTAIVDSAEFARHDVTTSAVVIYIVLFINGNIASDFYFEDRACV